MNLKAKKWMFLLLCGCVMSLHAARVDTLQVYNDKMKRDISVLVFVPDALEGKLPVLFLLHGYGEDETAWSRIANLEQMADANRLLIVCPDGEKSWYWDSPMHPELQFETFISEELPAYIDAHYPTYACREGRAVTGFRWVAMGRCGMRCGIRRLLELWEARAEAWTSVLSRTTGR